MQARLSMDILSKGRRSKFLRTSRGRFYLRELYTDSSSELDGPMLTEYTAIRRAPSDPSENVLVTPHSSYSSVLTFQGISTSFKTILESLINDRKLTYLHRTEAETNLNYKQFVTYTIIQNKSKILAFRRGRYNRAASFLRGAQCIGFGGHVTEEDSNLLTFNDRGIRANAAREISEEISFKGGRPNINPDEMEFLGILNDDSSDVGVRHVGIILRYWAPDTEDWQHPMRGEASVTQLRWIETQGSEIDLLEFEYWSQICLRKFYPYFLSSGPAYKIVRPSSFDGPHLLCVLGSVGSGKSVTTARLCESASYRQVNTGRVVARILGIPPVPQTPRLEFQQKAHDFISSPDGPKILAKEIVKEVEKAGGDRIIVDGIRQIETLERLKETSPISVCNLFVYTPPDVAYELYMVRDGGSQELSLDAFMKIYNAPVESQVRLMIQDADAVIYNWFGLENYELAVKQMINELGLERLRA